MNKKGFTLVELLAVIVVLGIILVIAVPKIGNIIDNEKEALYQDTVSKIEKSISIYLNDHLNLTNNDNFTVSLNTLCNENYLNCPVLDPRTKQNMSGEIMVMGSTNGYTYKFMDTTNMVLWYDAEYNNGLNSHSTTTTTWKDLSGNNKNGTLTNFASPMSSTSGWVNNGLVYDGANDKVAIGNQIADLFKSSNTVEITINFFDANSRDIIFGNYAVANCINYERYNSNNFRIYFNNGSINWFHNQEILIANNKMLLTYVYDKENSKIYIYKNGVQVNETTINNSILKSYNYNFDTAYLGADYRTGDVPLKGVIYSARIYNSILTDGEIKHNYEIDKIRYGLD